MPELVRNTKPLFNENLFSIKSLLAFNPQFNCDSPRPFGFTPNNSKVKEGQSFYIDGYFAPADTNYNFDFADALSYIAEKDGIHVFQFNLFIENFVDLSESSTNIVTFLFINGSLSTTYERNITDLIDINSITDNVDANIWQSFNAEAGDLIEIGFRIEKITTSTGVPVLTGDHYFSAFKLELVRGDDEKSPSPYSLPYDFNKSFAGFAYYVDSLATPTITIGTSYTQITIDALGANILDYLPKQIRGIQQLWATNKITPVEIGDDYDGRFDCTITARTGTPSILQFIIDISGATAGTNVAFTGYMQTIGTVPYNQSLSLDFFTLTTFLSNGGILYARTDSGSVTIGRRNIKISRKSKYIE